MKPEQKNKIKHLAKNPEAFEELKSLFEHVIKERDEAKKHLNLLESAISNDYDSIIITDLNLENPGPKIIYVNDCFTKLTGYSKEEAIGQTPRILQGPKTERATLDRLKKNLKEGKSFFGQAVNYRKDGSEFINQWDIHPLYNDNGEITHWVSYQHDITKRKFAEATFNETEIEFDNLIEYSKRTLLDINKNGVIVQANKAFRTLTGFDNDELIDTHLNDLVAKDDLDTLVDLLDFDGASDKKFELVLKTKNDIPVQVEVDRDIHPLKSGELIRLTIQNVSMQKKVLKTLEQRLFNVGALVNKKTEFSYAITFENDVPKFTYLSDGFEQLTGYTRDAFLQDGNWEKLIAPEDAEKAKKHLSKVIDGIDTVDEFRLLHKNGDHIRVLDYAQIDLSEKDKGKIRITGSIVKAEKEQEA
jgi:PAS domain S-box-containing protein